VPEGGGGHLAIEWEVGHWGNAEESA
jgi:hypothetical protein